MAHEEEEFNEDVFESMLNGTFEDSVEDEADAAEDLDSDEDEHQEDTDQEEESEDDEELDEAGDGELDEDSEDSEDDEEEDTLVEDNDSDDEGDVVIAEESEDDTDTEVPSDGEVPDTDKVDYKAFYDAVVNAEFVVNGKKVKGFSDPQKIIQSQQMAGGFSEKMAGFKQYRPFMAPLKDRGMLDDQAKFDLAMNLVDGDKEAIKAHLKSLDIDPLDLDMDTINYNRASTVASSDALVIEDVMERAKGAGIEDRVRQVVGKEWDSESFDEFVKNPSVREDLLTHIESGAYDAVQDKIAEMSRLDYNGTFGSMNTISKYRAAVRQLQAEAPAPQPKAVETVAKPVVDKTTVNAEKAKIEQARKESEYKAKATKQEAVIMEQRKKASSVSKSKVPSKPKAKFDPMKVEGEDLDSLMDFLISGGR
jgi:hypothetical protein